MPTNAKSNADRLRQTHLGLVEKMTSKCKYLLQSAKVCMSGIMMWILLKLCSTTVKLMAINAPAKPFIVITWVITTIQRNLVALFVHAIIGPHRTHSTDADHYYRFSGMVCVRCAHQWALQNGWTDWDAVWGADSCGPEQPCIRRECAPEPLSNTTDRSVRRRQCGHLLLLL